VIFLNFKKIFPNYLIKKIKEIYKTVYNSNIPKPHLNMTTKGPSCKQIIVSMSSDNIKTFMTLSNDYIININWALKNVKSNVIIDFICLDYRGPIFILNEVAAPSDICIVLWNALNTNIFLFLLSIFLDFIFILFYFSF